MSATPPIQPLSLNVRPLASRTLAYVRHIGPYASDCALFERLFPSLLRPTALMFVALRCRDAFRYPDIEYLFCFCHTFSR